jgi:hypothetical protein
MHVMVGDWTVFPEPLCPTISVSGGRNLRVSSAWRQRDTHSRIAGFSCPNERTPEMASLLIVAIAVHCSGTARERSSCRRRGEHELRRTSHADLLDDDDKSSLFPACMAGNSTFIFSVLFPFRSNSNLIFSPCSLFYLLSLFFYSKIPSVLFLPRI